MQQLRVVDLAQTMGITARELIFKLRSIGVSVDSEEDTLDLGTVKSIITGETLQKRPREVIVRRDKVAKEAPSSSALDRLAKRRRIQPVETEKTIQEVQTADKEAPAETEAELVDAAAEVEVEETPAEVAEVAESPDDEGAAVEVAETEIDEVAEVEAVQEAIVAEDIEPEADAIVEEPTPTEETSVEDAAAEVMEPAVAEGTTPTPEASAEAAAPTPATTAEEEHEGEVKPEFEVTEEELTAQRPKEGEDGPKRVRKIRAKTPLESTLRELSPDEIRQRLQAQKAAEKKRKEEKAAAGAKGPGGRKAKAAADAKEIRELLNKFEEQKLKGQTEPGGQAQPSRPAPQRPGAQKISKKARRRQQQQEQSRRPAPPSPTRTVNFKDGEKPEGPIILSEMVTARELAEKLNVTAKDLLALLIQKGMMVTTNQSLPHELAEEICSDLGIDAMVASAEEVMEFEREEAAEQVGEAKPRPPVVTVMGHVDHGKTSLLDRIRSSRVAEGEAGGITQHIGASRIETSDGRTVVFVDTPGHEAFTQMRARGAQVTDIVILVVAADDGVMPQTVEAINHARAAKVPLVVAINKIDKSNANPDKVKTQLSEREVLIEEWGGDVPSVAVSAKTGDGIDDLLETVLLVAELGDLKASDEGLARGVVLEARKEKGRGIVATVLVQQGTLSIGDYFFSGSTWGRVRAITDDAGNRITSAGPSDPAELMGFEDVPQAGDVFQCTEDESKAFEVARYRSQRERDEVQMANRKVSLENLFESISEGEIKELNVVVKADVQGSVEVLREALASQSTDKVKLTVLQGSVGAVTTNDVMLASASNAIVIGFNVRPERTARDLADAEQVDIRLYTVIYDVIDEIRKAMAGLLEPIFREEELGHAEVREVFKVPKIGAIAGSHVIDGVIKRTAKVRLLRDNVVIHEGEIGSLRRFKDDASEVRQGFDCGIGLERYQDIKVGDVIEAFEMIEIAAEL
jgi:translation initiation factor IF-2